MTRLNQGFCLGRGKSLGTRLLYLPQVFNRANNTGSGISACLIQLLSNTNSLSPKVTSHNIFAPAQAQCVLSSQCQTVTTYGLNTILAIENTLDSMPFRQRAEGSCFSCTSYIGSVSSRCSGMSPCFPPERRLGA